MRLNIRKIELELQRINENPAWLAKQMGRKRQWVHYLLHNKKNGVTLKTVARIGQALGIDPKDLII